MQSLPAVPFACGTRNREDAHGVGLIYLTGRARIEELISICLQMARLLRNNKLLTHLLGKTITDKSSDEIMIK